MLRARAPTRSRSRTRAWGGRPASRARAASARRGRAGSPPPERTALRACDRRINADGATVPGTRARARRTRPRHDASEPGRRGRRRGRRTRSSVRAGTSARAARTPRSSRSTRPGNGRAARRCTSRSSRARTTARRRPASTRSSMPASLASSRASAIRTRGTAAGSRGSREAGVDVGARRRRPRVPVPPADRGVANVGDARAALRDVQGRDHARRPRPRPRIAVGLPARRRGSSCTSYGRSRTRSRSAWAPFAGTTRASTRATCRSPSSHVGSRSGGARCPTAPSSSSARGRCATELEALAADGVQSLLLEGGPTLAAAFLEAGLVDKLLVFVAPRLSGDGPSMLEGLPRPLELSRMEARPIGEDVLVQAYLNEP